ncbi:MAG: CRISPR-associated RAMP protein Csx7 [Sandaracinaceae bacterium]
MTTTHPLRPSPFFDRFQRRTRLRAVLETKTGLRIGMGRSVSAVGTDLPLLRNSSGTPFIPGASIKGVLRSAIESLVRARDADAAPDPLEPRRRDDSRGEGDAVERAREKRRELESSSDVIGRIFGTPGLASHVVFADARPLDAGRLVVETRDGVAIDRDLGRVSGSKKYDFEVVPAGTQFDLEIVMNDLNDAQEGAVVVGLDLLDDGLLRLGGFKSRGLGLVGVTSHRVEVIEGPRLARSERAWGDYHRATREAFFEALEKLGGA